MADSQWQQFADLLEQARNIEFDAGLTDDEMADIERTYAIHFPPDLREFLQTALPVSDGFPIRLESL